MAEQWEEELGLANVRPLERPMAAGPNDRWVGEDELGNKMYETPTGQRYSIRPASEEESKTTRAKVEDWIDEGAPLPTWDQVIEGAKALPEAAYDSVSKVVRGEGKVGDVLGAATTLAAPGATKIFDAFDPTTTRIFFSAPKNVAEKATEMLDNGFTEQEIAGRLGVWQDPKSLKWVVETDDSTFDITPYARVQSFVTSPSDIFNYKPLPIDKVITGTNILNDVPELQNYSAGIVNPEILKRWGYDENVLGFHDRDFEKVFARRDQDRSTMLHEVQHAIDSIEHNDAGANPQKVYHDLYQIVDNLPAEAKLWLTAKSDLTSIENEIKNLELQRQQILDAKAKDDPIWSFGYDQDLENISSYIVGYKAQRNELKTSMKKVEAYDPELYKNISKLQEKLKSSLVGLEGEAHLIYEGNEGETRARIVQARADMKPEERYSTNNPLKATEDTWSQWDLTKLLNEVQNSLNRRSGIPDPWANVSSSAQEPNTSVMPVQEFAKGGMVEQPTMDPVSKNPVPPGATPEEVRDDVPIMASEGEYVIPANVVRYLGLDRIEKLVNQAKKGLAELEQKGRIGGQTKDDLPFSAEELQVLDEEAPAPAGTPRMATGGMVRSPDPDAIDPETGLPYWMLRKSPRAPIGGSSGRSEAEREADKPTGLAASVSDWTPAEFNKYAEARGSVDQKVGQALASFVPFGGLASRVRERYLERTVPQEMMKMIESGVDLQGNPLSTEQLDQLRESYSRIGSEPLSRIGGISGVAKAVAEESGLIKPRKATVEQVEDYNERVRGDSLINRGIDSLTKSSSTSKSSSDNDGVVQIGNSIYRGVQRRSEDDTMDKGDGPAYSSSETSGSTAPSTSQRPKANPFR